MAIVSKCEKCGRIKGYANDPDSAVCARCENAVEAAGNKKSTSKKDDD